MLELRDLVKLYPSPGGEVVRALDGVSLTVGAGELVALYGPSGSGKTTLLEIVAALTPPDAGRVALDGRDVSFLRHHRRGAEVLELLAELTHDPQAAGFAHRVFPLCDGHLAERET
jgi:ABC-type lipoprotein export system ATPase subunit